MTVEEIKAAIDKLTFQERCELEALLNPVPDDTWDQQMRSDLADGGKLAKLSHQAQNEARTGALREFPEPPRE